MGESVGRILPAVRMVKGGSSALLDYSAGLVVVYSLRALRLRLDVLIPSRRLPFLSRIHSYPRLQFPLLHRDDEEM